MVVGNIGRRLAALVVVGVVASGCMPAVTVPTPAPTPPVQQTPAETAEERQQRLDYEAAEKSYRAFRAEYNRVLRAGGAKESTADMRAYAGNGYLTDVQEVAAAYDGFDYRRQGDETIASVKPGGYSRTSIVLSVCEDTREVKTVDKTGKKLRTGELRLNTIEVKFTNGAWKLWSGTGKKVDSCD